MIYNDDLKLIEITEQRWRNIISLAIKRNIFRVFFNNLVSVSCIKTVMSPVNDEDDAFIVSVSHSFRNENSANLLHKYRSKESLSDIMLSSNLLQNFIQTNLQNQSKHIMLYDLNLTQFYCIEFTEIIFKHFLLRHERCMYYCIDQIKRLDTVDLRKLYNTTLKSKNIMFFENLKQTRADSRDRTIMNMNALKLEMTICKTVNNRTSFLEELSSS